MEKFWKQIKKSALKDIHKIKFMSDFNITLLDARKNLNRRKKMFLKSDFKSYYKNCLKRKGL